MKKSHRKTSDVPARSGRRRRSIAGQASNVPAEVQRPSSGGSTIPSGVVAQMEDAMRTGRWLVAVFRVENEKLYLDRTAMNFPRPDLDLTSRLFVESVSELKLTPSE